jgi:hypothetical protein
VAFDGVDRDEQALRDLAIALSLRHQFEHTMVV